MLKDEIINKIVTISGFNKNKITLLESKRSNKNIYILDYHIFEYEKELYILDNNKLKKGK